MMAKGFLVLLALVSALEAAAPLNNSLYNQTSINLNQLLKQLTPDSTIAFDLKLVNVYATSAQFELIDDNLTTINYVVSYTTRMKDNKPLSAGTSGLDESAVSTKTFEMQTNSVSLLNKQEELLNRSSPAIDDQMMDEKVDSGEKYNSEERLQIRSKPWVEVHRFVVNDLESNQLYEINFDITAKLAHLSASITKGTVRLSNKKYKETKKTFNFKFVTTFDIDLAAEKACQSANNKSLSVQQQADESTCYASPSDCTKCKSTCFRKQLNKIGGSGNAAASSSKPILCEPCPCDQSKSTGECLLVDSSASSPIANSQQGQTQSNNFQPPVIKCKQCIEPYTGDQCKDCMSEGLDFYKNEEGLCVKCECNNNAALDNGDAAFKSANKNKRKCNAITGMQINYVLRLSAYNQAK